MGPNFNGLLGVITLTPSTSKKYLCWFPEQLDHELELLNLTGLDMLSGMDQIDLCSNAN